MNKNIDLHSLIRQIYGHKRVHILKTNVSGKQTTTIRRQICDGNGDNGRNFFSFSSSHAAQWLTVTINHLRCRSPEEHVYDGGGIVTVAAPLGTCNAHRFSGQRPESSISVATRYARHIGKCVAPVWCRIGCTTPR